MSNLQIHEIIDLLKLVEMPTLTFWEKLRASFSRKICCFTYEEGVCPDSEDAHGYDYFTLSFGKKFALICRYHIQPDIWYVEIFESDLYERFVPEKLRKRLTVNDSK